VCASFSLSLSFSPYIYHKVIFSFYSFFIFFFLSLPLALYSCLLYLVLFSSLFFLFCFRFYYFYYVDILIFKSFLVLAIYSIVVYHCPILEEIFDGVLRINRSRSRSLIIPMITKYFTDQKKYSYLILLYINVIVFTVSSNCNDSNRYNIHYILLTYMRNV